MRRLDPVRCRRCGAPTVWPVERCRECEGRRLAFDSAVAAFAYAGAAKPFIRAWKERGLRHLAAHAAELVATVIERPAVDVICPVPPDPARQLRRSTHPAEGLARALARRWETEHALLVTRAPTGARARQADLHFGARGANVRDAFRARGMAPGRVLLVDDVYTTGATASEAARALRRAGATRVEVVTFARTLR